MRFLKRCGVAAAVLASLAAASPTLARTFNWAYPAEVATLDPHGTGVASASSIYFQIYEPLIRLVPGQGLEPALAERWESTDHLHWRFTIRQNVKFHDGTPLTADDVVFSIDRARGEGSNLRDFLVPITAVNKIDNRTVEIVTKEPRPILPVHLTFFPIMSKAWSLAHNLARPARAMDSAEQNYANFNANGTGPFKLTLRRLDERTELVPNENYWAPVKHNLDKLVFRPIRDGGTRIAALVSGEIDLVDGVPVQDVDRLRNDPNLKVGIVPEWREIYFGLDMARDALIGSDLTDKNPFKDIRVRKALYQAIDSEAIRARVMRGLSDPGGSPLAATMNGYDKAADARLPYDPETSKKLLAEAGYPQGFKIDLNCPNDRYLNDAQICLTVASMLSRVGIKANLVAEPASLFFQKVFGKKTSFFMFGQGMLDGDADQWLSNAALSTSTFNFGGYKNPKVDEMIRAYGVETDAGKRTEGMKQAIAAYLADVPIIPMHRQVIVWAYRKNLQVVQPPNNVMPIHLFRFE